MARRWSRVRTIANPASRFVRALPFAIRVNATVRQPLHFPDSSCLERPQQHNTP